MSSTLFPPDTVDPLYSNIAHQILDEMSSRGNKVAQIRKSELLRLEGLFNVLDQKVKQAGLQTLTLDGLGEDGAEMQNVSCGPVGGHHFGSSAHLKQMRSISPAGHEMPTELDSLDGIGISSYEFLSIIDQITNADVNGSLGIDSDFFDDTIVG